MSLFDERVDFNDFDGYIRQGEPSQVEKSQIWKTAIGLQQVDGLTPSAYLLATAKEHIAGTIALSEVHYRIESYYKQERSKKVNIENRTEEADKVSARIAEILSEKTFSLSPAEYLNIHRRLFDGLYAFAGKIRDYNISKSEWVLNGETVLYAGADTLRATLEYDLAEEKKFSYQGLSQQQTIEHIARFIAYLWQIHLFGEGNTRTTAVFLIKYLRALGFEDVNNDFFAHHSWYFRNALVRANYNNIRQNVDATNKYLENVLGNMLFGETNELKNRYLHVNFVPPPNRMDTETAQNRTENQEIFPIKGEKFLANGKKFPVIGLKIMDIIKGNPSITILELSKQLNISDRAVKNNLTKLKNADILKRIGPTKGGHWQVLTKAAKQ